MFLNNLQLEYKIQIITVLSGVLIAILTTYLAYSYARKQESKKEKRVYMKTLSVVDANLDWQLNQLTMIEKSLKLLKEASLVESQIIIGELPTRFDTKILQNSIDNLTDYKDCNELLLKTLIFYLNHIEDFNYQLNFESANRTLLTIQDAKRVETGIMDFFESLNDEYLEKIKIEIDIAKKLILEEQK